VADGHHGNPGTAIERTTCFGCRSRSWDRDPKTASSRLRPGNAALIDEQSAEFPLQSLFPTQVLGQEGTTIRIASSPDDHRIVGLTRQEGLAIAFYGTIIVDVLDAAVERYGIPSATDIAPAFPGSLIDPRLADRLARATVHYLSGDPDAAGHLIAPRLEGLLRHLARSAGVLVIREPRGVRSGWVVSVGDVLNGSAGASTSHGVASSRTYWQILLVTACAT
jgi:hypothetical protein